jgi:hypothetical protein
MKALLQGTLFFLLITLLGCKTTQQVSTPATPQLPHNMYALQGTYKIVEVDKLGYIYLVRNNNEIVKLDADYQTLFTYSLRGLGDIHQLNVDNPQKLMVYYADYNNLIFLDNTLSEIKRLDLESLSLWDMQGATLARDNSIWLLDNANIRLIKIDESGKMLLSTNEQDPILRQYLTEIPQMINKDNMIYLNNGRDIGIYDEFGVHQKNYSYPNDGMQILNKELLLLRGREIIGIETDLVRLTDSSQKLIELKNPAIDFYLRGRNLYWIDSYGLIVQQL